MSPSNNPVTDITQPPRKDTRVLMQELIDNHNDRPYLPKKKTRQLKLKQAFRAPTLNWQRYPKDKCIFRSEINKHVYQPPGYTRTFDKVDQVEIQFSKCCDKCFLTPCFVESKPFRTRVGERIISVSSDPELALKFSESTADDVMKETCGIMYHKRMKRVPYVEGKSLPDCIRKGILDYLVQHLEKLEERRESYQYLEIMEENGEREPYNRGVPSFRNFDRITTPHWLEWLHKYHMAAENKSDDENLE